MTLVAGLAIPQGTSNDDVYLAWLVSGQAIGESSAEALFINRFFMLPLTGLYAVVGWVPWYGLSLLAVHAAALAAVFVVVGRHLDRVAGGLAILLSVAVIGDVQAIVELSWNSAAMSAAAAGIIWLLADRTTPWVGIALVVVGVLLRWESAVGALIVLGPVVAYRVLSSPARRVVVGRVGVALLAGVVVFAAHWVVVSADDDWSAFRDYNGVRGPLHDSSRLDRVDLNAPEVAASGITENDVFLFRTWFFDDAEVFGKDQLTLLDAAVPVDAEQVRSGPSTAVDTAGRNLVEHGPKALGLVAVAAVVMADGEPRRRIAALGVLAMPVVLVPLLSVVSRVHGRVLVGLIVAAMWGALSLAQPEPGRWLSAGRWSLLVIAGASALMLAVWIGPDNADQQSEAYDRFERLDALDPDGVFLLWDEPLSDLGLLYLARLPDMHIVPNGWLTFSPPQQAQLGRLGVDDQFLDALDDDAVHIATADPERGAAVVQFLADHRSVDAELDEQATERDGVLVLRRVGAE